MDPKLIVHVFSSLQKLEKNLSQIKSIAPYSAQFEKYAALIPQQENILLQMRRTANSLQLELAKKQWPLASRSLQVFYGLHHMVRAELIEACNALSRHDTLPAADLPLPRKETAGH